MDMDPDLVILVGNSRGWGLTYYNTVLALGIRRAGIPLVVVSTPSEQSPGLHERLRGTGIHVVDDPGLEVRELASVRRAAETIASVSRPGRNVVHCGGIRHSVAARFAAAFAPKGNRIIVTTSVGALHNGSRIWPLYYFLGSLTLNLASHKVLTLCGRELRKMRRFGLMRSKSSVNYFWIDQDSFSEGEAGPSESQYAFPDSRIEDLNVPKVIYLAQFYGQKGHIPLIQAWKAIVQRDHRLLLVLAGSGPLEPRCKLLATELEISDRICFLPRVPREVVPHLLRHCAFAVVTSKAETFGSCIVEPLLAGLPVCTTHVGIGEELAAADGVRLINETSPKYIAASLSSLLDSFPTELERMRRGRDWVIENCSVDRAVARLARVWRVAGLSGQSSGEAEGSLRRCLLEGKYDDRGQ